MCSRRPAWLTMMRSRADPLYTLSPKQYIAIEALLHSYTQQEANGVRA
jgi:hypothetical protein